MKKVFLVLAVASMVMLVGCKGKQKQQQVAEEPQTETKAERPTPEEATLIHAGDVAPEFTVTLTDGKQVTLSKEKGKVVLINFWATWCPHCVRELNTANEKIVDRFKGKDFVFLPISRQEERDVVVKFAEEKGYKFTPGLDPDRSIYSLFASDYIPRNIVVDKEGNVAWATVGYDEEDFGKMLDLIDELIKK